MGIFDKKGQQPPKRKQRFYIDVAGLRIAPDIIGAYQPIKRPDNPTGLRVIFANGRFIEIETTEQEQKTAIALLDELKTPKRI